MPFDRLPKVVEPEAEHESEPEVVEPEIEDVEVVEYESGQLQIRKPRDHIPYRGWKTLRGLLVTLCMYLLVVLASYIWLETSIELNENYQLVLKKRRTEHKIGKPAQMVHD